jgi:hypothetical protein
MTTDDLDISTPLTGDQLRFHDPAGRRHSWTVRPGSDVRVLANGALAGTVTSEDGLVALRQWVPADRLRQSKAGYEALENQVRAGIRLAERYRGSYPSELTRLIGHDLDAAEPFLLLEPARGRPLATAGQLLLDDQEIVQIGLLRAVLLLSAAGVVHGNITAAAGRWDGSRVQVGDFAQAAALGDARRARPELVDAPAEIRLGTGQVSPADDVWAAGTVILSLAGMAHTPADLARGGEARRTLLDGVFEKDAEARPAARELLRRLGADTSIPAGEPEAARAVAEGEAEFDRVLAGKWPPPLPAEPVPPPVRRGWRHALLSRWGARAHRAADQPVDLEAVSAPQSGWGVRCPICLDMFTWPDTNQFYAFRGNDFAAYTIPPNLNRAKRDIILRDAYIRCPNPSGDREQSHYLPAVYGAYGEPLVIGLVGATRSGKSHLLAAMIAAIESGGLRPYDVTSRPVDFAVHDTFLRNAARPLLEKGTRLSRTDENIDTYTDALLITSPAGTRPVTFFDVAGGDLVKVGQTGRFLAGAGALIFVVDPETALRLDPDADVNDNRVLGDPTFATVLGRLNPGARHLDIPTAIVLNKADRLRATAPMDVWLRRPSTGRVDAASMHQESRDVYAFLHARNSPALRPFHECRRCTLHVVSATGGEAVGQSYPRGAQPRRVLEPLIALLAMTGVLPGADTVGRW